MGVICTRLLAAEMPCGNMTFQRRSISSTFMTSVAVTGAWLTGLLIRTKSGPIWATGKL